MYAVAAASAASAATSIATADGTACGSERVEDWGTEGCSTLFLECLEDIWERDANTGYIEFSFDPQTQVLRRSPPAPPSLWVFGALDIRRTLLSYAPLHA